LNVNETEEDDPDWDDVAILIGSEIVRKVRAAIRDNLKYTCSAGIAQNKMLAKLGSAHKKPNQQTIIRNRAIQQFLSDFKFTKIRKDVPRSAFYRVHVLTESIIGGLGGKLGDSMTEAFNTDTVSDLLPVPIEQLKQKLGDDTGTWVHSIIRGKDLSEVNSRTQIKSMLSAKSFRPSINTPEQANRWLRIFAADIYSRLVEEGVVENKRRPKTINLHHRQGGQTKSRQGPIPSGKKIDEVGLFELAKNLLGQIILEGRVWPCANLSLSVGGFEDGISGNMGIGAFLVKGDEAKALQADARESSAGESGSERPDKRRRIDKSSGIKKFFAKTESTGEHDDDFGSQNLASDTPLADAEEAYQRASTSLPASHEATAAYNRSISATGTPALQQRPVTDYMCSRCDEAFESADDLQNHQDWHFAKDLHDEDRGRPGQPSKPSTSVASKKPSVNLSRKKAGRGRPEKGQSKLAFG